MGEPKVPSHMWDFFADPRAMPRVFGCASGSASAGDSPHLGSWPPGQVWLPPECKEALAHTCPPWSRKKLPPEGQGDRRPSGTSSLQARDSEGPGGDALPSPCHKVPPLNAGPRTQPLSSAPWVPGAEAVPAAVESLAPALHQQQGRLALLPGHGSSLASGAGQGREVALPTRSLRCTSPARLLTLARASSTLTQDAPTSFQTIHPELGPSGQLRLSACPVRCHQAWMTASRAP